MRKRVLFFIFSIFLFASRSFAACEYWTDPQGIPHLRASEKLELLRCLGYAHGKNRGWEMDLFRRTFQGRRSEILGYKSIESDFLMRWLGLSERAHNLFMRIPEADRKLLEAYTDGVNRAFTLNARSPAYEFKDFQYEPEKWQPEHTIGLMLLQSFDQTRRSFSVQLEEVEWLKQHGEKATQLFGFDDMQSPWETTILKDGEYVKDSALLRGPVNSTSLVDKENSVLNLSGSREAEQFLARAFSNEQYSGSNSWVIGRERSATGHAWLANDPHLKLSHPTFWHWVDLSWNGGEAAGATFPGVPFIVSGTNLNVSWGVTNSFLPVARLFEVAETDMPKMKKVRPWIPVNFFGIKIPFFFKTFEVLEGSEHEKLVILPLLPKDSSHRYVLRWTGFEVQPDQVLRPVDLLFVKSVAEADRQFARLSVPSWNFVFADVNGGIGYRAVGLIPKLKQKNQFGIELVSWEKALTNKNFNSFLNTEEMPHLLNPARNFVVTANNMQWPNNSIWKSGHAQYTGFRAFRIEELLLQRPQHDQASLQRVQCDVQAVDARFLTPGLLAFLYDEDTHTNDRLSRLSEKKKGLIEQAILELSQWDFEANLECLSCGFFRRWVDRIQIEQKLNTVGLHRLLRGSLTVEQRNRIFDSMVSALEDIQYFAKGKFLSWREIHQNSFSHLAGSGYRNISPLGTPGDEHSVNPGSSEWLKNRLNHHSGASQRLLVEMSRPPRIFLTLPGTNMDSENRSNLSDVRNWIECQTQSVEFPTRWDLHQAEVQRIEFNLGVDAS